MRTYNQTSQNIMPLMMNFTTQTPIVNEQQIPLIYNDMNQMTDVDMRIVGTRCLRSSSTRKKNRTGGYNLVTDRKNAIDDSKSVR